MLSALKQLLKPRNQMKVVVAKMTQMQKLEMEMEKVFLDASEISEQKPKKKRKLAETQQ